MRRLPPALCAALLFLPLSPVRAQESLDDALRTARPPARGVALAVGADKTFPRFDVSRPEPGASLPDVAAFYDQVLRRFGAATAIAPTTMTALNVKSDDFLPPGDAFKLLAGSLSDPQWAALTGEQGLGRDDLNDAQRALFTAVVPFRELKVRRAEWGAVLGQTVAANDWRDLSAELPRVRLRLVQRVQISLPNSSGSRSWFNIGPPPGAVAEYSVQSSGPADFGPFPRVPNAPKRGQLDFAAPVLQTPVPLDGLKTVGDLTARISRLARLEIVADARLETRAVTTISGPSAPAADLLRALAFCVTGTYRQVGPAFVLTDDVAGIGTRKSAKAWADAMATAARQKALNAAGERTAARKKPGVLAGWGDPLAITTQQRQIAEPDQFAAITDGVVLPFASLTPAQQAEAKRMVAFSQSAANTDTVKPSLNGRIVLDGQITLQLLAPSLPGVIDLSGQTFLPGVQHGGWMFASARAAKRGREENERANLKWKTERENKAPSLAQTLRTLPRRGVLARANTTGELRATLAVMRTLGLNELWLDVFSDGVARIPGTAWSASNAPDMLAAALRLTRGTGIRVFAVVALWDWGPNPPPEMADLTTLGETSATAASRRQALETALAAAGEMPLPPPASKTVFVSPMTAATRAPLADLLRAIAAHVGLAGIAWRATMPPGYEPPRVGGSSLDIERAALGFTLPARLAFLRQAHVDPVDLLPAVPERLLPYEMQADTYSAWRAVPPLFDDFGRNPALSQTWDWFRRDADVAALRGLFPAKLPLFVLEERERYGGGWLGTWDNRAAPFPSFVGVPRTGEGSPFYDARERARAQSKIALARIVPEEWTERRVALQLADVLRSPGWNGVVLDMSKMKSAADALAKLTETPQK